MRSGTPKKPFLVAVVMGNWHLNDVPTSTGSKQTAWMERKTHDWLRYDANLSMSIFPPLIIIPTLAWDRSNSELLYFAPASAKQPNGEDIGIHVD